MKRQITKKLYISASHGAFFQKASAALFWKEIQGKKIERKKTLFLKTIVPFLIFLFLPTLALFASPISDKRLSEDLDDVFGTIQAERRDKIEYIDRYKELGEKESEENGKKIRRLRFRFFVKTRRGADENFVLEARYVFQKKKGAWVFDGYEVRNLVQTSPPVIRPAKQGVPKKEVVYDLIRSELLRRSSEARKYEVYKIETRSPAIFRWAENYTISEYKVPLTVKLIVRGRVTDDPDYFLCKWTSLVRYDPTKKRWLLRDLDTKTDTKEITLSCKLLEQTFSEKMNHLFPGEKK